MSGLQDYLLKNVGIGSTRNIIENAKYYAENAVLQAYPYAVSRNEAEVRRIGEQRFQTWEDILLDDAKNDPDGKRLWSSQRVEAIRIYVSAYTTAYLEKVAEKDKATGRMQPQPIPQPATPSNVASLQDAKITFKDIQRNPDEDLYIIELTDPGHLDEPQLVYVHVGDGEPQQAASAGQSYAASSYSSSVVPFPSQPSTGRPGTGKVQHIYLKRKR
jgi:hypothetical protein